MASLAAAIFKIIVTTVRIDYDPCRFQVKRRKGNVGSSGLQLLDYLVDLFDIIDSSIFDLRADF